jgi:endonuclease/exonuclease/phosphatase (EEP) superfamily protein YafD
MRSLVLLSLVLLAWIISMRRSAHLLRPKNPRSAEGHSVVTYNIQRLPWKRKGMEPLMALEHSVIYLQECFFRWSGKSVEAHFPDYYVCKGTLQGVRLMNSGLVILSRFPILESEFVPFKACNPYSFDRLAEKGILSALVRIDGRPVRLVNTHLQSSSQEYDPYSLLQLDELFDYLSGLREPYLLGGDFNIDIEEIRRRFPDLAVHAPAEPTIYLDFRSGHSRSSPSEGYEGRVFDYFVSSLRCSPPAVIRSDFSDHRPVETLISF